MQRTSRLVDLMDALILGAVPPYSTLLGGKLVASVIGRSRRSVAQRPSDGSPPSTSGRRGSQF
jgi:hypothetical protein